MDFRTFTYINYCTYLTNQHTSTATVLHEYAYTTIFSKDTFIVMYLQLAIAL